MTQSKIIEVLELFCALAIGGPIILLSFFSENIAEDGFTDTAYLSWSLKAFLFIWILLVICYALYLFVPKNKMTESENLSLRGVQAVLSSLEKSYPGFSRKNLYRYTPDKNFSDELEALKIDVNNFSVGLYDVGKYTEDGTEIQVFIAFSNPPVIYETWIDKNGAREELIAELIPGQAVPDFFKGLFEDEEDNQDEEDDDNEGDVNV